MRKAYFIIVILLLYTAQACADKPDYELLKKEIEDKRVYISKEYSKASGRQRDSILNATHNYLFNTLINNIFVAWYDTPWDFNGHTKIPGKGTIACGYFVATTLQDVGFKLPRIKWAQMESEKIIQKLSTDVKRFHNVKMNEIVKHINDKGDGLYIVGLDRHVGFISKQGSKLQFIHSNYYRPEKGVMTEALVGWNPLNDSKYRVIGKILNNDMVVKWISGYNYD